MSSDGEWYYAANGQQQGPIDVAAMRQWLSSGQLHPTTLVWSEGMTDWLPAQQVPALGAATAMPAAAPLAGYPASPGYPMPLEYYRTDPSQQVKYGGFWIRVVAYIIDFLVTAVIGAVAGGCAGGLIGGFMGANHATGPQIVRAVQPIGNVLGIIVGWLYFALMESSSKQATLGKMALGMTVTNLNGERISFGRATGRYFAKFLSAIILLIGFIMVGFTDRKQGLHDMIAGTLVRRKL